MSFIARACAQFAERPLAIDDEGRILTYGGAQKVGVVWSERLGAEKRLVLLLADNTVPSLEAYLGLVQAGHAVILLGAEASKRTLADMLGWFAPDTIIAVDEGEAVVHSERPPQGGLLPDLAVLLSTSGSTGSPKLVRFDLCRLEANAKAIAAYLELSSDERPLANLPFHYSYGLSIVHSHLCVGATLLLSQEGLMTPRFWTRLAEATSFSGVPFTYQTLLRLRLDRKELPHLRTLTQAGGRLAPELVRKLAEISEVQGWRLFVMYGQTEAGPRISYLPPEEAVRHPESIGIPIPGVRLTLADETGASVPRGEIGELVVDSPAVMLGYAESRADLARGDDQNGRLVTGDLARQKEEGFYVITGRKSRFIKLQGVRVGLEEVERRLTACGHSVTCVGEDNQLWVVLEGGGDWEAVRTVIRSEFSFPMASVKLASVETLPRSSTNKIQYARLLSIVKARGHDAGSHT